MDMDKVAYHGAVVLVDATHSVKGGYKMKLRLVIEGEYKVFAGFTKRRGTKGGSRHNAYVSVAVEEGKEAQWVRGEVMFLGWTVSNSAGAVVAFEIEEEMFQWCVDVGSAPLDLVMTEINDDETEVDQVKRAVVEEIQKGGPLSKHAARLCTDEDFVAWVKKQAPLVNPADFVRDTCRVSSRALLDHNPVAAERYKAMHSTFLRATVNL